MTFNTDETAACQRLVGWALREDIGDAGDLTSQALIPEDQQGRAEFVAHAAGIVAGLPAVELVLTAVDSQLRLRPHLGDGAAVQDRDRIATISGPMRSILAAERTGLN